MSPEEDGVLEVKVKLSGLTKQEYIIRRLTDREITVVECSFHLHPSFRSISNFCAISCCFEGKRWAYL